MNRSQIYVALLQNLAVGKEAVSPAIYLQRIDKTFIGNDDRHLTQDWKCVRLWKEQVLCGNLETARADCQASPSRNLLGGGVPQSRIVYIQQTAEDMPTDAYGLWLQSYGKYSEPQECSIAINISSLLEHDFHPFEPNSMEMELDNVLHSDMCGWVLANEQHQLYLPAMDLQISANHQVRICSFVNHEQRQTIVLLASLHTEITFGAPQLVL
ncbi:hypothetical protein BKA65DRAFT_236887 [Rhexocercosporidium sp. MPI-PUGE-AT-0058]|nr:hypothetical protein BKA65DRAFT_236887 [Rhexocercosporidium sp. MPI-PUGE-AT-0058]